MSGHSHWATIKHKKGAIDAKRGKLFSKLSRAIIIAAKHGGGDPETNLKLRYAIGKAREVSMPRDNIERAIKRGTGEGSAEVFEELQYGGTGPGGVFILVDILTDNRNRTNNEIRKIFERGGGEMRTSAEVAFRFKRKGVFLVDGSAFPEDTVMSVALEAGAEDMKVAHGAFEITCDPHAFSDVQAALVAAGIRMEAAEVRQVADLLAEKDAATGRKVLKLIDILDDHDDVQAVYTDLNVTEEMTADA